MTASAIREAVEAGRHITISIEHWQELGESMAIGRFPSRWEAIVRCKQVTFTLHRPKRAKAVKQKNFRPITERQLEVLEVIECLFDKLGYSPSLREVQAALGLKSLRGVTQHLDALKKKGFITRTAHDRSIRVLIHSREESKDA
jgi:DNA-binding MarR family transcriptional regulator